MEGVVIILCVMVVALVISRSMMSSDIDRMQREFEW